MQSFVWYSRRILSMSVAEMFWKGMAFARDYLDRCFIALGRCPAPASVLLICGFGKAQVGFEIPPFQLNTHKIELPVESRQHLLSRADRVLKNRLTYFNLENHFIGNPIDWNKDHSHLIEAPRSYSSSIDYRDFRLTGDCKQVWEPNRHHQFGVLARAYYVSGDPKYASAVVDQMTSWMEDCPYLRGMNWRSPLELGIRLINWVFAIGLIRESGLVAGEFSSRLMQLVYLQLYEITRKYSRGSSGNNHLIGEAAGVFVASSYFKDLPNSQKWAEESSKILEREIFLQTFEDGCSREQATGYHLFVLQFFLIAGLVGRWSGREFSPGYWQRIEGMLEFSAALCEGSGLPPSIGDSDDGYVLDLGAGPPDTKDLLGIGAVLFSRSDFKLYSDGFREPAFWLLGPEAKQRYDSLTLPQTSRQLTSKGFKNSGYYLLQCGSVEGKDRISLVADCGELGFKSIAAHGHADALSFVLRAFGHPVLVDPGTFDYFSYPEWRTYFRRTRAHNTVEVDGQDQSVMLGPFMWGRRAHSRCLEWDPWPGGGGRLVAEHDGYNRLKDPVLHRRSIELDPTTRTISIIDEISASAHHRIAICFHLAENCKIAVAEANSATILLPEGQLNLRVDHRMTLRLFNGSEAPKCGWISKGYHRKAAAPTLVAEGTLQGCGAFSTVIRVGQP
jgi:hypothetical protein